MKKATFAGGCFWCVQPAFRNTPGVIRVLSGYAGSQIKNPTYDQVVSGEAGAREAVQVEYDPQKVSFAKLLPLYWLQIDPTDAGGQFADRGENYKTAIYYQTDEEKKIAEDFKKQKDESGIYDKPVVVEILPFQNFYPAEDYHQDYDLKNPVHYQTYSTLSGRKGYVNSIKKKLKNNP